MDQLHESRADEPDEVLRARLGEHGYLFLRDLLDEEVRAGALALVDLLREGGWIAEDGRALPASGTAQQEQDPVYRAAVRSPHFHRVPYAPALHDLVRRLLQEDVFTYPSKVLRATPPASWTTEAGRYAHQDYSYWGVEDMLTTWVPFMPVPTRLGGLAVRPGSHRGGPVPLVPIGDDTSGWASTDYRLGDVIVFHCLTAHAALPNRTDGLRVSGDFRWQPVTSPVKREFLHGRSGRTTEMFSTSLSREPWWRPVPAGVPVRTGEWDVHAPPRGSRFFEVGPAWSSWRGPEG